MPRLSSVVSELSRKTVIVLNTKSGFFEGVNSENRKTALLQKLTITFPEAEILKPDPEDIGPTITQAVNQGVKLIIVGGGDGTLNAAANLLADTQTALAVLPMGTFNYFARDLKMPLDPERAVDAIAGGFTLRMDLGQVEMGDSKKQFFLHNASLGVHSLAVEKRNEYKRNLGINKALGISWALLETIWKPPRLEGRLESREGAEFLRSPFVFIGNNTYDTNSLAFLNRKSLTDGRLTVLYSPPIPSRSLLKLALLTLVKRNFREIPELIDLHTEEVTIRTRKKHLKLILDGEFMKVPPPLTFRIHPQSLTSIVPQEAA
ncbi:MAG: diacylglycerol/lipid kinase family protein [Thermodesulfobacteriota bacterium]